MLSLGQSLRQHDVIFINIAYRNVSFKYPGSDDYALRNVSFKVDRGQLCVRLFRSGSVLSSVLNYVPSR